MQRINRALLRGHAHVACALRERRPSRQTPSGAARVFPDAPAACDGLAGMPTRGRAAMAAPLALRGSERRGTRRRPLAAAALDAQHHLLARWAEGRPPWRAIVTARLGIHGRHDWREACGGARGASAEDAEPPAPREAAPRAGRPPRLPWVTGVLWARALAQRAGGPASPRGAVPPAPPGPGQAPHARCLCLAHAALPSPGAVLQGRACTSARGESRRRGRAPARGTAGASRVFFQSQRPRARPRPWEARAPGWRGAGAPRRWRGGAKAPVTVGGRPERGRSRTPWSPSWANRCPPRRRAACATGQVAATAATCGPAPPAWTACARRQTRAAWVGWSTVSQVESAGSGTWLVRGRIAGLLGGACPASQT